MFLALAVTLDSYGKVGPDRTRVDPQSHDYQRAARDAIHFPVLFDRLIQNLRLLLRLRRPALRRHRTPEAAHLHSHIAFRGTISRADLQAVIAATHHQVWGPSDLTIRYDGDILQVWHQASGRYVDPATGELLPMSMPPPARRGTAVRAVLALVRGRGRNPPSTGPGDQDIGQARANRPAI